MSVPPARDGGRRKDGLLTTGDMARLSANTLRTVRFYEESGLVRSLQRTQGGHRLFPPSELDRLIVISDLRSVGLSLEAIRDMLSAKRLGRTGAEAAREVVTRLDEHIAMIGQRLRLFQRLLQELEEARSVLVACKDCEREAFPEACSNCEVIKTRGAPGRTVPVLWEVEP